MDQSVGTGISRIAGFLRDSMMTALFERLITDAWVLAFRGPHFFRRYFGEGAVSQEIQSRWGRGFDAELPQLRFLFLLGSFLLMALVISLSHILSNFIGRPSLGPMIGVEARVEKFFYPMVIMIGCWFYFSFQTARLHLQGDYRTPAVAPVFLNIAMISSTILAWWGNWPMGLSWGVAVGGLMVILYASKIWNIDIWKTPWNLPFQKKFLVWPDGAQIRWFLQLPFILLPLSLLQWVTLLQILAVARLPQQGLPSYFYLCDRLLELPFSLFVVSPCLAMTQPLITANKEQRLIIFTHGFFSMFIWIAPATLGLWMMSEDLVRILFQHGRFLAQESHLTGQILRSLALQLFVMSMVRTLMTWKLIHQQHSFLRFCGLIFVLLQTFLVFGIAENLQQILDLSLLGIIILFFVLGWKSLDLGPSIAAFVIQRKFAMFILSLVLLYGWLITPTSALLRLIFAPLIYFVFLFWAKVWTIKSKD